LEVGWALWTFFWVLLGFFQGFYWVFLGAFVGFFKNPEEMEIYFDKNDLIKNCNNFNQAMSNYFCPLMRD